MSITKVIPKVSVVMPNYNWEKYIAEAIESILNQSYLNLNLIVINDGSKDNTSKIVKNLNLKEIIKKELKKYIKKYKKYFKKYNNGQIPLNPLPNVAIIKNKGVLCFGSTKKEANIINDIYSHTIEAILKAQKLGGYKPLGKKDIFKIEYWDLEQAKLKK